ncbi:MAG: hypothetical protein Q7W45_13285 [Bacteroidota bacterium]|nr:hypothetical protein [Bacteroidota bacterium]MDP3144506.1 hypothetical protein [Bacteroidota bacterium]MDP3555813.1 hypothetical protein [Bacteroidota bacterium]
MLLNPKEFEQKIEEIELKKGLKLFLKNKIELVSKTESGRYIFFIDDKIPGETSFQIKSDKIINYKCFCANQKYCQHLAACLFYLQQEILVFSKNETKNKKKILKPKRKTAFNNYLNKIKTIIKPYLIFPKLETNQINEIHKKINFELSGASTLTNDFYFHLAVISELPKISNIEYSLTENEIEELIKNSIEMLEISFNSGLSATAKDAFIEATFYSLKSQTNFKSGYYSFLISRASVFIKDKLDFENLKALLKKRKQNKNNLNSIDRKIISEIQLSLMQSKLIGKPISYKNYENAIELPLALAEIEFLQKNYAKGFKLIQAYAEKIKGSNINKYLDYLEEVILFAKKYGNLKIEKSYLIDKFICGYFIDEKDFDRVVSLTEKGTTNTEITELLTKIKRESVFFTFEKIALILLRQNRLDELIEEIKKEKNKFRLLNKIGIKKLPEHDLDFLKLYIKHFINAVSEAKFPYFQQQLFDIAKIYLDGLPIEIRKNIVATIQEKMIYEKHMEEYISKVYPDAQK